MGVGRRAGAVVAGLFGYALLKAAVITPRRLVVKEERLPVPTWPAALDGLRVALVGDVHAGAPWVDLARVGEVVRRVVAARPDLVLLLGDHVADVTFGHHLDPEEVAEQFAGLLDIGCPVVGVLGNHDWYAGGHRVRAAFEAVGLPVLEEAAMPVLEGRLWVAGVGDLWERNPSVPDALASVPDGAPVVLMTHNPDCVVDVPQRVALVVAGHTHGGQVAVRARPFHHVSERTRNRWLAGWYPQERLYVTAGVGSSMVPLRTVLPEVVVLELVPG